MAISLAAARDERLERAKIALDGLAVGDSFGWPCFRRHGQRLPAGPWHYTDDTNMALSIVAILRHFGHIAQDVLAMHFARYYQTGRGYGPGMRRLLPEILGGKRWQEAARSLFRGEGSFGNGGAMRVAPLGAYFADDLGLCAEQARLSAEVTHAHPEGIAGTIAVAVGAAVAYQERGRRLGRRVFIEKILPFVPASVVRDTIVAAANTDLSMNDPIDQIVGLLGNGGDVTAQDTVAYCLWCAGEAPIDYEKALWLCSSGGGDVDTNCAIVGGIVACSAGRESIPAEWLSRSEPLPAWAFEG